MNTRVDEMKGQIKQGVGSLTGNEKMKNEGQAEAEAARLRREAAGVVDESVGKAQEVVGEVTDDPEDKLKGKARQAKGDVERSG